MSEHKHNDLTMMNLSFDFFNIIWTTQNGFWQQYGLGLAYICTLSVTYPKLGGLIENINSWKAIGKKFSSLIPPPSTYTSSAPKWMLARSRRESEVGFCVNHYAKIRKKLFNVSGPMRVYIFPSIYRSHSIPSNLRIHHNFTNILRTCILPFFHQILYFLLFSISETHEFFLRFFHHMFHNIQLVPSRFQQFTWCPWGFEKYLEYL